MRLLLTGATGFVGRNIVLRARDAGWSLLAPVRDAAKLGRQLASEGVPPGNVRPLPADPALWPNPLRVDGAIHCAGALFERHLAAYLRTNVRWTMAALERLPPGCPMVVLSSQSAGGPTPPVREARCEDDADDPVSFYGESKLRMERAVRRRFRGGRVVILRPPMVLGPRDAAALQLFQAAKAPLRPKPGLRAKVFSFVSVEDLIDGIVAALPRAGELGARPFYIASRQRFTDWALISGAAASMGARGFTLPLPQGILGPVSHLVDRVAPLRRALPSLGGDRVREIRAARWVVDPSAFEAAIGWAARRTFAATLAECRDYYAATGGI